MHCIWIHTHLHTLLALVQAQTTRARLTVYSYAVEIVIAVREWECCWNFASLIRPVRAQPCIIYINIEEVKLVDIVPARPSVDYRQRQNAFYLRIWRNDDGGRPECNSEISITVLASARPWSHIMIIDHHDIDVCDRWRRHNVERWACYII